MRQPEHVAELEESLRSARFEVSSERVSQQPTEDEYPWQFDTEVRFPLRPASEAAYMPSSDDHAGSESTDSSSKEVEASNEESSE